MKVGGGGDIVQRQQIKQELFFLTLSKTKERCKLLCQLEQSNDKATQDMNFYMYSTSMRHCYV